MSQSSHSQLERSHDQIQQKLIQKQLKKDRSDLSLLKAKQKKPAPKPAEQEYNKFQIPADWELAKEHFLANRVGQELLGPELQDEHTGFQQLPKFCKCCGLQVQRKQFEITCETERLGYLGSGFCLFFDFQKFAFGIVFMIFMTSGLQNLASNLMGDNCLTMEQIKQKYHNHKITPQELKNECLSMWVMNCSFANKINNENFMTLQSIVNFATVIIVIIALQFFRKSQREVDIICDEKNLTAGDYGLCVKFVPNDQNGVNYKKEIKQAFENEGFEICDVNLSYDLTKYNQIMRKLNDINEKKVKNIKKIKDDNAAQLAKEKEEAKKESLTIMSKLKLNFKAEEQVTEARLELDKQFEEKKKELDCLLEEFKEGQTNKFTGIAYVTFMTEDERDECLDKYELKATSSKIKRFRGQEVKEEMMEILGQKVVVELAPEPLDVYWQHQKDKTSQKLWKRAVCRLIDLGVMALLFWAIIALTKKQNDIRLDVIGKTDNEIKATTKKVQWIGQGISIFVAVCNGVLSYSISITTAWERWSTKTGHNVQLATKLAVAQFVNTALLQFLITQLIIKNYYGQGGLIYNQTFIFATDMGVTIIMSVVNIPWLLKVAQRKYQEKYPSQVHQQQQAQAIYEQPTYNIAILYAGLIKTMFFCAFYAPVIPIGTLFSMVLIGVLYWVNKYNLLRRSIIKEQLSHGLSREMTELIEYTLIIYSLANFAFRYFITSEVGGISLAGVAIGVINAFLPMEEINKRLFPDRPDFNEILTYEEAVRELDTDYGRANPATQAYCNNKYIEQSVELEQKEINNQQS